METAGMENKREMRVRVLQSPSHRVTMSPPLRLPASSPASELGHPKVEGQADEDDISGPNPQKGREDVGRSQS